MTHALDSQVISSVLLVLLMNLQVISLGDTIKFSLSPSKSKVRLSTNVAGVPVDESNLVCWL